MKSFIHLHTHSDYSLMRSTARVKDLIVAARREGMSSIALTDDLNLFAAPAFAKACEEASAIEDGDINRDAIKPIIGCDLGLLGIQPARLHRPADPVEGKVGSGAWFWFRPLLLVLNATGYGNLCSLLSILSGIHEDAWKLRSAELLAGKSGGLVALSGGRNGELVELLSMGEWQKARERAGMYREIFGKDRYWLELVPRGIPGWRQFNTGLLQLAREFDLGLVASNDVRFTCREDQKAFEIFAMAGGHDEALESRRFFAGREAWLKSAREMERMFGHVHSALENSVRIAEMIEFRYDRIAQQLPIDIPSEIGADRYLNDLALQGLAVRYGTSPSGPCRSRLSFELAMSERLGLAPWFLIAKEHVDFARSRGIGVGPGRDDLPGSLIAYCLSITDLDPLRFDLLPYRFFERARKSKPTFDLDVEFGRRKEVIDHVAAMWGFDHVASIPSFGSLRVLTALKMAGEGLRYPTPLIEEALASLKEGAFFRRNLLSEAVSLANKPRGYDTSEGDNAEANIAISCLSAFYLRGGKRRRLIETAATLEDRKITEALHAAGVVMANNTIESLVPLYRIRGTPEQSVQCSYDQLQFRGLSQFNFLGLKTLETITRLEKTARLYDPAFRLSAIPLDDEQVWYRIGAGDTEGIFMLESTPFRKILVSCNPSTLLELAVLEALYRPSIMEEIEVYRSRKVHGAPYTLPHAALDPILHESQGLLVFHEQATLAIAALTGFDGSESERLCMVFSSRKATEDDLAMARSRFIDTMVTYQSCDPTEAVECFEFLRSKASSCFPKSHALAYCLIAYRQAWLSVHFPELAGADEEH